MNSKKLGCEVPAVVQVSEFDRFVRVPEICRIFSIGKSTWFRWVATGKAPKGTHLGANTTAWKASEIQKLIDSLSREAA